MTLATVTATIATMSSALVAADHLLARSTSIIQNSVGPLLWALVTKQPVRVSAPKGEATMVDLDTILAKGEKLVLVLDKLADYGIPVSEVIAPQYRPIEEAVKNILDALAKAATDHEAAGGTMQSAMSGMASVAQSVAANATALNMPADTAAKIASMSAVVGAIDPNAYQISG